MMPLRLVPGGQVAGGWGVGGCVGRDYGTTGR